LGDARSLRLVSRSNRRSPFDPANRKTANEDPRSPVIKTVAVARSQSVAPPMIRIALTRPLRERRPTSSTAP
jgi:hypothetical protein